MWHLMKDNQPVIEYLTSDTLIFETSKGRRFVGYMHTNGYFYSLEKNGVIAGQRNAETIKTEYVVRWIYIKDV